MAKAAKKPVQIHLRIKEARSTLGLTQAEFGKPLGFSANHISSIENGVRRVTDRLVKSTLLVEYQEKKGEDGKEE